MVFRHLRHWLVSNWLAAVIFVTVMITAHWVLIRQPMFYTHDYLHGARIAEYARGIREGQWPVIWSQNFGFGYGMPLFEFYAPLPYLVGAIFYLFGCNLITATKLIIVLANVLSFIGLYGWARTWWRPNLAALCGGMLTLASYRAMDIFVRGALSEIWAIAALAWVFWGLTAICYQQRRGLSLTVFGGVMLVLSHNITTMLAAPILLLYVLLLLFVIPVLHVSKSVKGQKAAYSHLLELIDSWRKKTNYTPWQKNYIHIFYTLISAALITFALTAFYLLPAFFEKNLTQVDTYILGDYFDYHLHFLYLRQFVTDNFGYGGSGWGPEDGLSFFLGWAQLLGLSLTIVIGGYYAWRWRKQSKKMSSIYFFAGLTVILALTLLLTTDKSSLIWQYLSGLLAFAQFPWRFLGISIVMLSLLSGAGLSLLPPRWQDIGAALLTIVLVATSAHYFQGEKYLDEPSFYQDDPFFIRDTISPILVDYLPQAWSMDWLSDDWSTPTSEIRVLDNRQPQVLVDKMHAKLYQFEREASGEVELVLAYYPGWTAQIDGQDVPLGVSQRGNITVALPAGKAVRLGLQLQSTSLRYWANFISTVAWILVISYGLYPRWQKK